MVFCAGALRNIGQLFLGLPGEKIPGAALIFSVLDQGLSMSHRTGPDQRHSVTDLEIYEDAPNTNYCRDVKTVTTGSGG